MCRILWAQKYSHFVIKHSRMLTYTDNIWIYLFMVLSSEIGLYKYIQLLFYI